MTRVLDLEAVKEALEAFNYPAILPSDRLRLERALRAYLDALEAKPEEEEPAA